MDESFRMDESVRNACRRLKHRRGTLDRMGAMADYYEYWEVSFAVDPAFAAVIHNAAREHGPGPVFTATWGYEGDEFASLTLPVEASNEAEARTSATTAFEHIIARAGLETLGRPQILGVRPPKATGPVLSELVLAEAEQLAREGRHEAAVLRAQTAADVFADAALQALFSSRLSDPWHKDARRLVNRTLADRRSRNVFEALTGQRPEHQEWWDAYHTHLQRRHAVAHEGLSISRAEVNASLDAVAAFIGFLRDLSV